MKLKQRKTNQTKSWVIIKNDKIDKPLERLTKKKREKAQITNTRNGKKKGHLYRPYRYQKGNDI